MWKGRAVFGGGRFGVWIEQKTGDDNGNEDGLQENFVFSITTAEVKSKMNKMNFISFRHPSRFRFARGMRAKT
jgi:hypothetical protein